MAVTVPGAELMLANPVSTKRITVLKWILCHTIVGTVSSAIGGRHYHIYIRGDGSFIQRQDLLLRSAASVQANPYSIAIVAEDMGKYFPPWSGSNVPPYTPQQVETLILILSWICRRFGLPASAIRTTCLGDANGIGWHRLGIDGDFPDFWPLWGRRSGCLETSLSTGKPCPGDNRIWQIVDRIVPALAAPKPPTPQPVGDDMVIYERMSGSSAQLVVIESGKQTRLLGADSASRARNSPYYLGRPDAQTVGWWDKHYGPVAGL
jgi:hypothetical protein